jgi:hypothetical protein
MKIEILNKVCPLPNVGFRFTWVADLMKVRKRLVANR